MRQLVGPKMFSLILRATGQNRCQLLETRKSSYRGNVLSLRSLLAIGSFLPRSRQIIATMGRQVEFGPAGAGHAALFFVLVVPIGVFAEMHYE